MDKKKKKIKSIPRLIIERYGLDDKNNITFIDIHDEATGRAIFFEKGSSHYHGFLNGGIYNK